MIHYVTGDATNPVGEGPCIIAHSCNDRGGWGPKGRSFASALSSRWQWPERLYRDWKANGGIDVPFELGNVQFVNVQDEPRHIEVCNMIAQHGYSLKDKPAIDLGALERCLKALSEHAAVRNLSVHMPRIGAGLGGRKWSEIEPLIDTHLHHLSTYVYDLLKR